MYPKFDILLEISGFSSYKNFIALLLQDGPVGIYMYKLVTLHMYGHTSHGDNL